MRYNNEGLKWNYDFYSGYWNPVGEFPGNPVLEGDKQYMILDSSKHSIQARYRFSLKIFIGTPTGVSSYKTSLAYTLILGCWERDYYGWIGSLVKISDISGSYPDAMKERGDYRYMEKRERLTKVLDIPVGKTVVFKAFRQ